MKAYVLEEIGKLVWKEVELPRLKKGEVLVQVKAVGICGSDIPRIFTTGTYHFPTIPGHEFSGVVAAAYGEEERAWVGKRVGVFPLIPCTKCLSCQQEKYEMCRDYNYLGSRCDGGFAEYVAVPVWNLLELPEKMDMREAAMLEPASVALHAVRRLCLEGQRTVALFGLGTIGSIMVQWFHYYGIEKLYATGHWEEFGEVMKQTASTEYVYQNVQGTDGVSWIKSVNENGVDIAVDCVGTSKSLEDCLEVVRPGGQILIVANPKGELQLTQKVYWQILRKQITICGTWNSSFRHREEDDWCTVIRAIEEGKLNLSALISHELPFEALHEGLAIMREKNIYRNKIMITRELL